MKNVFTKWIEDHEHLHVNNTLGVFDGYTSYGTKKSLEFFTRNTFLPELIIIPLREMIKMYNSRPNTENIEVDEFRISDAWYTKYKTNGRFPMHKHNYGITSFLNNKVYKQILSVIYILKDDNKSNSTSFFVPHTNLPATANIADYRYDTGSNPEIGEGSILIFPSSLYHEVYPSIKPGRITISYNIDCSLAPPGSHTSP